MTELEKDLLANGFSEKDLKKFRTAREREKQDEQAEGDNALDYDETLRKEIKEQGSTFTWIISTLLIILFLFNITSILEKNTTLKTIEGNSLIIFLFILLSNIISPFILGFKSWRYKKINNDEKPRANGVAIETS